MNRESPLIRGTGFLGRDEIDRDEIEKDDIKIRLV
jgi:hypothetical protein